MILDEAGVDYAGLWFNMPGRHCLSRSQFIELVSAPTRHVRCVGVTTQNVPDEVAAFVRGLGLGAVQLHGFWLPAAITRLRDLLAESIEIFQVLHVQHSNCLESALLSRYVTCGAHAFVIDSFVSRDQVGSSGQRVPFTAVGALLKTLPTERTFLAGGLDADAIREVRESFSLRGVDMDSSSRVSHRIDRGRVQSLVAAARGEPRRMIS
jgi:phosphoribosylanthranilate isomerase